MEGESIGSQGREKKIKLEQYEIIDGKPHGGGLFGRSMIIPHTYFEGKELTLNDIGAEFQGNLIANLPIDLQIREPKFIYRPPRYYSCFTANATLGMKAILWGRAFKVYRYFQGHRKRSKKAWINGHRKRIRS